MQAEQAELAAYETPPETNQPSFTPILVQQVEDILPEFHAACCRMEVLATAVN